MENNIQTNKALILIKAIKNLFLLLISIIPVGFSLYLGFTESDTILNMISSILLGMAASSIILGLIDEFKRNYDSGILVGIGLCLSILSGVFYFGNSILTMFG